MTFDPKRYFLDPFEFFGTLVPGTVGTFISLQLVHGTALESHIPSLSGTAGWAAFLVASYVLGLLIQPPAHILNKIYDWTYRKYQRRKGDPLLEFATGYALEENPAILKTGSVYKWTETEVEGKEPNLKDEIGRIQGISKLFRALCFFSLLGIIGSASLRQWNLVLLLLVIALLTFFVFASRRWSASCYVYQRFKILKRDIPPPSQSRVTGDGTTNVHAGRDIIINVDPRTAETPSARVRVHRAFLTENPTEHYFINVVNEAIAGNVEISHVSYVGSTRLEILQPLRKLPATLAPRHSWETWVAVSEIPSDPNVFRNFRVRLSTGETFDSEPNLEVPQAGFVPGDQI